MCVLKGGGFLDRDPKFKTSEIPQPIFGSGVGFLGL